MPSLPVERPNTSPEVSPELAHQYAVQRTRSLHGWGRNVVASTVTVGVGAAVLLYFKKGDDMKIALITAGLIGVLSVIYTALDYAYHRLTAPGAIRAERLGCGVRAGSREIGTDKNA